MVLLAMERSEFDGDTEEVGANAEPKLSEGVMLLAEVDDGETEDDSEVVEVTEEVWVLLELGDGEIGADSGMVGVTEEVGLREGVWLPVGLSEGETEGDSEMVGVTEEVGLSDGVWLLEGEGSDWSRTEKAPSPTSYPNTAKVSDVLLEKTPE